MKRYGRWSTEAGEQWEWIKKLDKPNDSVAKGPWLKVYEGCGGGIATLMPLDLPKEFVTL